MQSRRRLCGARFTAPPTTLHTTTWCTVPVRRRCRTRSRAQGIPSTSLGSTTAFRVPPSTTEVCDSFSIPVATPTQVMNINEQAHNYLLPILSLTPQNRRTWRSQDFLRRRGRATGSVWGRSPPESVAKFDIIIQFLTFSCTKFRNFNRHKYRTVYFANIQFKKMLKIQ